MDGPSLCSLPTEIQHQIVLALHPSALVSLRQTNRWFHTHVSLFRLERREVLKYLHERQFLPQHRENYPCFSCLSIKPKTHFTRAQISKDYSKIGRLELERYCLDCGVENKKFKPGTLLEIPGGSRLQKSQMKVFCAACTSVQAYFCGKCHWCAGCIATLQSWTARSGNLDQRDKAWLCPSHLLSMSDRGIVPRFHNKLEQNYFARGSFP